jgi:hypothetical protein
VNHPDPRPQQKDSLAGANPPDEEVTTEDGKLPTVNWIEAPENQQFTEEDVEEVRTDAASVISHRRKRAAIVAIAFLLSCACNYPFFKGHALHAYWKSVGQYLLLFTMGVFLAFVQCIASWWAAWQALRDVEKSAYLR